MPNLLIKIYLQLCNDAKMSPQLKSSFFIATSHRKRIIDATSIVFACTLCGCESKIRNFGFRILGLGLLGITICGKLEVEDWKWNG